MVQIAEDTRCRLADFAEAVLNGVVGLTPHDFAEESLTLTFGLSAWMRSSSVSVDEASVGLNSLRDVLLEVGRMDRATEPVPLRPRDVASALIIMTVYLRGLLERVSTVLATPCESVVDEA